MMRSVRRDWFRLAIPVILGLMVFLISRVGCAQESTLRVAIKPERTIVKNGNQISVMTTIRNTSHADQHLQVWSCSYHDNWAAGSPYVKLQGSECNKNGVIEVVLKPKEKYERELSLKITVPAEEIQVEKVTFRLGFKPFMDDHKRPSEVSIVWSNPITLQIRE